MLDEKSVSLFYGNDCEMQLVPHGLFLDCQGIPIGAIHWKRTKNKIEGSVVFHQIHVIGSGIHDIYLFLTKEDKPEAAKLRNIRLLDEETRVPVSWDDVQPQTIYSFLADKISYLSVFKEEADEGSKKVVLLDDRRTGLV